VTENSVLNYLISNCDNDLLRSSLDIIKPRKSAGSLAALDDFASDEYQNFLRLSHIEEDSAFGTERFPGMLMNPCQEITLPNNILDHLVEFYNSLYNDYFISISSITSPTNDIVVNPNIKQYSKLRIGSDIYSSVQAACHEKSSYILARFVQDDGTIDTYPGQIQFFLSTLFIKIIHHNH